jgi:hypothetical protein
MKICLNININSIKTKKHEKKSTLFYDAATYDGSQRGME